MNFLKHYIKQPIGNAALDFLNSKQMDEIAANGLCSVLQSLYIKNFMGEQAKYFLNEIRQICPQKYITMLNVLKLKYFYFFPIIFYFTTL